jgi:Domain of unknown function (DUF5615)
MARLYSNENLAIDLVEALRKFNYDLLSSYDAGQANQGIPDDEVLEYATLNKTQICTRFRLYSVIRSMVAEPYRP